MSQHATICRSMEAFHSAPLGAVYFEITPSGEGIALVVKCPRCGQNGMTALVGDRYGNEGHPWEWNGDIDRPTITPTVLHDPAKGGCGWCGNLTKGEWQ